jgi:transcriptional regulator with XRE-family HTH domain
MIETTVLSPNLLGFWTRCLRTTQHWSQEALAAAAGLTTRTIQRIEAGEPSTITSRRSLARALGYDDPDVFENPAFAGTVRQFIETAQDQQLAADYPDHMPLPAQAATTGEALAGLIDAAQSFVFNCANDLAADLRDATASLFDLIRDYADIWGELSHSDRRHAAGDFDRALADLRGKGAAAFMATRHTSIVGTFWQDKTPLPITIGYLTLLPAGREIAQLMVPKGLRRHV